MPYPGTITTLLAISSIGAALLKSIEDEFGWSRAANCASHLFGSVLGVLMDKVIGMVVDRNGVTRLALAGSILVCLLFGCSTCRVRK